MAEAGIIPSTAGTTLTLNTANTNENTNTNTNTNYALSTWRLLLRITPSSKLLLSHTSLSSTHHINLKKFSCQSDTELGSWVLEGPDHRFWELKSGWIRETKMRKKDLKAVNLTIARCWVSDNLTVQDEKGSDLFSQF